MQIAFSKPALGGAVVSMTGAVTLATGAVSMRGEFGSGDLVAFGWWSAFAAVFAYPVLHFLDRVSREWSAGRAYLAAALFAIGTASVWTALVGVVLGPWVNVFGFPIFWCWLLGMLVGFHYSTFVRHNRTWSWSAIVTVGLVVVWGVFVGDMRSFEPAPPSLLVILKEDLSLQEQEAAFRLFEIPPSTTMADYNPEGIASVSRVDDALDARLLVTFHPGAPRDSRSELIERARRSPLVERIEEDALEVIQP